MVKVGRVELPKTTGSWRTALGAGYRGREFGGLLYSMNLPTTQGYLASRLGPSGCPLGTSGGGFVPKGQFY